MAGFQSDISHPAMIKARQKLGNDTFKQINSKMCENKNEHIFSIDGSKVRVHEGFKKLDLSQEQMVK